MSVFQAMEPFEKKKRGTFERGHQSTKIYLQMLPHLTYRKKVYSMVFVDF
jgi:hypothetical protein